MSNKTSEIHTLLAHIRICISIAVICFALQSSVICIGSLKQHGLLKCLQISAGLTIYPIAALSSQGIKPAAFIVVSSPFILFALGTLFRRKVFGRVSAYFSIVSWFALSLFLALGIGGAAVG